MKLEQEPRVTQGPTFFAAVIEWMRRAALAVNPLVDTVSEQASQIAAMQAALAIVGVTGEFKWFALGAAPSGWVAGNGSTIGNAGSGATRANSDTLALFTAWWTAFSDAQLPILTSAGAASTRGASAVADWAALKRLTVFDVRDRFIRAGGSNYTVGTKYAGTRITRNGGNASTIVQAWTGNGFADSDAITGAINSSYSTVASTGSATDPLETIAPRPINIALLGCFKL